MDQGLVARRIEDHERAVWSPIRDQAIEQVSEALSEIMPLVNPCPLTRDDRDPVRGVLVEHNY